MLSRLKAVSFWFLPEVRCWLIDTRYIGTAMVYDRVLLYSCCIAFFLLTIQEYGLVQDSFTKKHEFFSGWLVSYCFVSETHNQLSEVENIHTTGTHQYSYIPKPTNPIPWLSPRPSLALSTTRSQFKNGHIIIPSQTYTHHALHMI